MLTRTRSIRTNPSSTRIRTTTGLPRTRTSPTSWKDFYSMKKTKPTTPTSRIPQPKILNFRARIPTPVWIGALFHVCGARNLKYDRFWNIWRLIPTLLQLSWNLAHDSDPSSTVLNFVVTGTLRHPCEVRSANVTKFWILGTLLPTLFADPAKSGTWEWICGMLFHAKFLLGQYILSCVGGKTQI